jgi:hypothetical protein
MTNLMQQPFSEREIEDSVITWALRSPRRPLAEAAATAGPGPATYLLFFRSDNPLLGPAGLGTSCSYVGAAAAGAQRLGRHVISFREAAGIDVDEVWAATLPCESLGAALFVEWLAIRRLQPVLQALTGLGSARPGSTRQGRPSKFDSVFTRSWVEPPTPLERATAAAELAAILAEPGRLQMLWPPLPE